MTVASRSGPPDTGLRIEDLSIIYRSGRRDVVGLNRVSLSVARGETIGVVGESGSGKSSLGLAIMRLLPKSARTIGRVLVGEDDLLAYSEREMRGIRGKRVGMVFQDSLASMNPVFSIGSQLMGTLRCHFPQMSRAEAARRAGDMLEELNIRRDRMGSYPHQFSGGMRQRVMIAAALASNPDFLIADESTSDLDTITQKQILELIKAIQRARGLGLIVISHDLGVIREVCHNVAVLYRGDLVELGPADDVFAQPQHWYTRGLLAVSAKQRQPDGFLPTLPSRAAAASDKALSAASSATTINQQEPAH